jgi:glyoxylase-like metal-dependent hydrolase (beta-lactamase superfamily II)
MISPRIYTGGFLATNGYLLETKEGIICFDAPEGLAKQLRSQNIKPIALLLTHGHFDHIWDAAAVQDDAQCPIFVHESDVGIIKDPSYLSPLINPPERSPAELKLLEVPFQGQADFTCGGESFRLFHLPGHSPGSVCFYHASWGFLIGGDVLFCGGVGRWDLPGGSRHALLTGLQKHLVPLPNDTRVYAGHGPVTTIGHEKETNPYLEMI